MKYGSISLLNSTRGANDVKDRYHFRKRWIHLSGKAQDLLGNLILPPAIPFIADNSPTPNLRHA